MDVNFLSTFEMWAVLVGALTPLVIALLAQSHFSEAINAVIGVTVILIAALGTVYFYDPVGFTERSVVTSLVMVFFTATTVHGHFLKPLGVYDRIKVKTSTSKV